MTVKVTYCGVEGEGRNVTAAKRDAAEKIEKIMRGPWRPKMIRFGKHMLSIYRDGGGLWWYYSIIGLSDETPIGETMKAGSCGCYDSPEDAERDARRHVAQCIYEYGVDDGMRAIPEKDAVGRRDHASWVDWQNAYWQRRVEELAQGTPPEIASRRADNWARYERSGFPVPEYAKA